MTSRRVVIPLSLFSLSMIFSENRQPLFGIMLEAPRPMRSGPRHLAGRVEGPVAVEAVDAELDAPGHADHAEVLAHRVVDAALDAVRQRGRRGAEPARDVVETPRPPADAADVLVFDDLEVRVPELRF